MGLRFRFFPESRRACVADRRIPDSVLLLPVCRGNDPDPLHRIGWLVDVFDADKPEGKRLDGTGGGTWYDGIPDRVPFQCQL